MFFHQLDFYGEQTFVVNGIQAPHFQTILMVRPPHFIVGNHRILQQGQALGGQCLLGDLSTLLALDTRWTIQFPMKEVGGGMEDTIMINTLDDWEQRSFPPHLPQNCCRASAASGNIFRYWSSDNR
jgi:hypothetical protein